jgi:hypothetical protein
MFGVVEFVLTIVLMSSQGSMVQWNETFWSLESCEKRKEVRIEIHKQRGLDGWTQELSECEAH